MDAKRLNSTSKRHQQVPQLLCPRLTAAGASIPRSYPYKMDHGCRIKTQNPWLYRIYNGETNPATYRYMY